MDSPRIAQSGFNLRGFPKLFDSLNGVSVITPKYTLALPGGVRGVRGTFHHPPQQLYHRGTLESNQNQAIKERNISLYCQIKRVHSLSCRWLPGNFSVAQSCAACSMGITGCLVAQCNVSDRLDLQLIWREPDLRFFLRQCQLQAVHLRCLVLVQCNEVHCSAVQCSSLM